ncbi:hypothetical protein EON65_02260 [archaeon]|nr:MAG: hypothetical protein EON65_02260 [archaeon]
MFVGGSTSHISLSGGAIIQQRHVPLSLLRRSCGCPAKRPTGCLLPSHRRGAGASKHCKKFFEPPLVGPAA